MNDFMTDTDIEMAENWETYVEGQHQIAGDDMTNTEKAEMTADWEPENMGPLLATITIEPGSEKERLYELAGGDGMGPNDDIPMDFGEPVYQSVEDQNGLSGTQEEQEAFRQEEKERLLDLNDTPPLLTLSWELPE